MGPIDVILRYKEGFYSGILTTLKLASIVWGAGLIFGTLLGYLVDRYPRWFKPPFALAAFILSGIPVIVFLVWAHYPLQVLMGVVIDPFLTAAWVLTFVNTFAIAQIISATLRDFPSSYVTAAKVCGISRKQTFWYIKFPIVMRQMLPSLVTSQVVMLQATLFASLISVEELFRVSQRINATAYKPVEIYTALAIFFIAICLPLNGFSVWFRNRFTKSVTEDY